MSRYTVRLSPLAIEDLIALHRWVADKADQDTADTYLARVEERIRALDQYPERGTPRDDLGAAMRTLAFERRLIIAYTVDDDSVTVLRVVCGARDLGQQF